MLAPKTILLKLTGCRQWPSNKSKLKKTSITGTLSSLHDHRVRASRLTRSTHVPLEVSGMTPGGMSSTERLRDGISGNPTWFLLHWVRPNLVQVLLLR